MHKLRYPIFFFLIILCASILHGGFDASFVNRVTGRYVTPHLEWNTGRAPLDILFLTTRYGARDIVELGQRFPVKTNVFLMERSGRKKVRYNEDRIMEIRTLAAGKYDLIVLARGDFTALPPDAQYTILDQVRNGSGLLLIGGRVPYKKLFEKRLAPPHFLKETSWMENFHSRRIGAFAFGKGRILHLPWPGEGLAPEIEPGNRWMAQYENAMLILIRAAWWVSGQDQGSPAYALRKDVESWRIDPRKKVFYRWRDDENRIIKTGTSADGVIPVPQGVPSGKYFCDQIVEGSLPAIGELLVKSPLGTVSLKLETPFLNRDQAIRGSIRLSQKAHADLTAVMELSDALKGDILERRTFNIPRGNLQNEFCIKNHHTPELGGYLKVLVSDGSACSSAVARTAVFFRAKKIDSYFQVGWEGPRNPIMARRQNEDGGFSIALNPYPFNVANVRKLALMNTHIIPYITSIWLKKTPAGEVMIRMQGRSQEKLKKLGNDHSFHRPEIRRLWEEQIVEKMRGTSEYGPILYSLGDENILDTGGGFGPSDVKGFRDFVRRKYGDIEKLNRIWNKHYSSFDEVDHRKPGLSLQEKNFPEWNDHLEYMEEMFILFHEFSARIIKRIDPSARVGTEGTFGQIDMEKFMKNLDWWGPYPSPVENEVMRSLFPDMPRFLWVGYLHEREPGRLPSCLEYLVKGTLNGIGWFSCDPGTVYGYYAPDYSESYPEKFTAEIKRLRFGTAQLLIDAPLQKSGISVCWDHLSRRAVKADPRGIPPTGIAPFIKTCYEHGIGFEFVTAQTLDRLKDTRILFLLGMSSMSRKTADAILEYVRNGGTVIADLPPALFDEYLQIRQKNPLSDLFGDLTLNNLPQPRVAPFDRNGFTADKVLQSPSGKFFQTRQYGKGQAILLNFHFGFASNSAAPETPFSGMILNLLRKHGVQPPFEAENCDIFRVRSGKDLSLLSFYSKDRKRISHVKFPGMSHVYECGRGYVGRQNSLDVSYADSTMRLFALFREKQTPPAIQAPTHIFAGDDLIFDLQAVPDGRTLLFRFYDPGEKEKTAASRSVNTGQHKTCTFRVPFNAADGVWTIRCTDMASGLQTVKKIAVRKRK